jgi:hypothetical protein
MRMRLPALTSIVAFVRGSGRCRRAHSGSGPQAPTHHWQRHHRASGEQTRRREGFVARTDAGSQTTHAGVARQQDGAHHLGATCKAAKLQSSGRSQGVSLADLRSSQVYWSEGGYGATVGEAGPEEPDVLIVPKARIYDLVTFASDVIPSFCRALNAKPLGRKICGFRSMIQYLPEHVARRTDPGRY